jgi:hypothetical protein
MRRPFIVLILCLAGYIGWTLIFPSGSWRYRLSIEVETPEGVKSGTAVREVDAATGMRIGDSSGASVLASGEAVVIDLDKRGQMFALLVNADHAGGAATTVFDAFPYPGRDFGPYQGILTREGISYYSGLRGKAELPAGKVPLFVRFADNSKPETVKVIDPRDFAREFGDGVRLKAAQIELVEPGFWPLNMIGITGEPMTHKIRGILPWLSDFPEPGVLINVNRDGTDRRPEIALVHGDFKR